MRKHSKLSTLNSGVKKRLFSCKEFEAAYIIDKLLEDKKKVLNVGCLWGRDYYYQKCAGREVLNLDLGEQEVPNLVIGDVCKRTSFKESEFDAVVMGEVLEHLFEDLKALREINRILKDDGILVITVPYYSDKPDYHVRIHSKRTIVRLVKAGGFKPVKEITRGGLISFSKVIMIPSVILRQFSEHLNIKYLHFISELDYKIGILNHNLFRYSKSYGGYFKCIKGTSMDYVEVNRENFIPKN